MTKAEYEAAYRQARKSGPRLTRKAMIEIKQAYKEAGDLVAASLREARLADASSLTTASLRNIDLQLSDGARRIQQAMDTNVPIDVSNITSKVTAIDEEYVVSANIAAGYPLATVKIRNTFVAINEEMIHNMVNRVYQDGYTYSDRIWRVASGYQDDVKRVITSGLLQTRDPVKIAGDVQGYISDGKTVLAKRYGKLKAGTAKFYRRIPKNVDYRALRLVRTELYAALKESAVMSGMRNPAVIDEYDWIMQQGRAHWGCDCPTYAHGSPYTAQAVPSQPHPNCFCYIQPKLRDRNDFVKDLARWGNGQKVDYLDKWNANIFNSS